VVKLLVSNDMLIVYTRKYFGNIIEQHEIPFNELKVKKNTLKISVFFGRENTLEIYQDITKIGDFFFNHFFWSNQKLKVIEARRFLTPYITGGEFIKEKEVDIFK